jgi:isochorismate hydrolase
MATPASTLDRTRAVLLVIDIQERLAAVMDRREQVIERTALVTRACHITGVPVVATEQYPKGLGPLEPAVIGVLDEAREAGAAVRMAEKVSFDCFAEPTFVEALAATGRTQLVIVGMETHICVTQTALAALAKGHDVHVVADACCSRDAANHRIALARLRAAGAVVTCAESAAYELVGKAGTPEFKALLAHVKG